jgi:hypothetical protein
MGRTRQYASARERQAAYRQRMIATTLWVDRASFERIDRAIIALQDETWHACIRGHPRARELYCAKPMETLEKTVAWILISFQQETAATMAQPCRDSTAGNEAN